MCFLISTRGSNDADMWDMCCGSGRAPCDKTKCHAVDGPCMVMVHDVDAGAHACHNHLAGLAIFCQLACMEISASSNCTLFLTRVRSLQREYHQVPTALWSHLCLVSCRHLASLRPPIHLLHNSNAAPYAVFSRACKLSETRSVCPKACLVSRSLYRLSTPRAQGILAGPCEDSREWHDPVMQGLHCSWATKAVCKRVVVADWHFGNGP